MEEQGLPPIARERSLTHICFVRRVNLKWKLCGNESCRATSCCQGNGIEPPKTQDHETKTGAISDSSKGWWTRFGSNNSLGVLCGSSSEFDRVVKFTCSKWT
jgi:hypothetical protein